MTFIDLHAHLDLEQFDLDRNLIVQKMQDKNIICYSNTTSLKNYIYTKKLFKNCKKTVKVCPGLYPQDAQNICEDEFNKFLKILETKKNDYQIIGEVGLDKKYCKNQKDLDLQIIRFKKIIEIAIKLNKPLSIHTRNCEKKVLEIIEFYVKKHNFHKFVLHCFMGKKNLISKISSLKIYVSIPMILFNNSCFENLIQNLSINNIFVETDSPFLHSEKKRNTPLSVIKIYEKIAQIKGLDKKEIENIIFLNYQKLLI